MKLSAVRNFQYEPSINNAKTKKQNDPSFKGGFANACVNFWRFVDNGGRALQFTVEDCTETNIPRSIRGAVAGYQYTKKINVLGFLQEAVREFLTGPTMCVTPVAILTLATKLSGKTSNTHVENIRNLSYITSQIKAENADTFKNSFFTKTIEDMLNKSTGKDVKAEDVSYLVEKLKSYNSTTDKKKSKQILEELNNLFQSIVKRDVENYNGIDFANAKYSITKEKTGETNFKNYMGYVSSWADDFGLAITKKGSNAFDNKNISLFKNSWIGRRLFVISGMIGITGILMSFIPKIYTKVSGRVNPNASAIYDEAKKNEGTTNENKEAK